MAVLDSLSWEFKYLNLLANLHVGELPGVTYMYCYRYVAFNKVSVHHRWLRQAGVAVDILIGA